MDVEEVRTAADCPRHRPRRLPKVYVRGGNHALEQRVGLCYYAMPWHMHIYPTEAAIPGWSFGGVYRFTKKRFLEESMPIMLQLPALIDEIHYADHLHPDGHGTGLFAKRFTTMIDCCPISPSGATFSSKESMGAPASRSRLASTGSDGSSSSQDCMLVRRLTTQTDDCCSSPFHVH
jgi:hypothetical protein